MTYRQLSNRAELRLVKGDITVGEYGKMTEPLDEEIRPHGYWDAFLTMWQCSECKNTQVTRSNYCPSCGAIMDADPLGSQA